MENEIWKDIPGYPNYQASNSGEIKTFWFKGWKVGGLMKPHLFKVGYYYVHISHPDWKRGKNRSVHRLIATTFIPNPFNLPCINHINGIKTDNRVENLEWCTWGYNTYHMRHILKHGADIKGVKNYAALITDEQAIDIMKNCKRYNQLREFAEKYGMTANGVSNIYFGVNWTHLINDPRITNEEREIILNRKNNKKDMFSFRKKLLKESKLTPEEVEKYKKIHEEQKKNNNICVINRKFNETQIQDMRERFENGEKLIVLEREYKTDKATMHNIVYRKTYRDIE